MKQAGSWEEAGRLIRRGLSRYSMKSIVDAAIAILDRWRDTGLQELQSAPWLTLLIVKVALEDETIDIERGLECPISVLDELRNMVWNVPAYEGADENPSVFLMLRSLIHTQLQLQRPETRSFLRWPALIARLPSGHASREQFRTVFGMEPDTWAALAYATLTAGLQGQTFVSPGWYDTLAKAYGASVKKFVTELCRDLPSLRSELRCELRDRLNQSPSQPRPRSEINEFPWLMRYPLLQHHSGNLAIWHRLVLARGLEQAAHARLTGLGQSYTDPFSKVFESHVLELCHWSGANVIEEQRYKELAKGSPKAVDAILSFGRANVLVESKMSLFHDQVLTSDRAPQVFMRLKRVREAILQGWRVGEALRDGSVDLPECVSATEDFLLIVTSKQLNLGSGEHLKRMFGDDVMDRLNPEVRDGNPTSSQLLRLPAKNIFVLDIEEFEHLTGAMQAGEVDLLDLLSTAAASSHDPGRSTLHFDQLLQRHCKRWTTCPLMEEAARRIEGHLVRALSAVAEEEARSAH